MWTEEQFGAWKSRQETKDFFSFLYDYRERLKEKWAAGEITEGQDHYIAMAYGDLLDLEYSFVEEFYGVIKEGEDDDG